jgi:hypothetical protein
MEGGLQDGERKAGWKSKAIRKEVGWTELGRVDGRRKAGWKKEGCVEGRRQDGRGKAR